MISKKLVGLLFVVASLLSSCNEPSPSGTITSQDAENYIGEVKTVRGKVASTKYASSSRGKPTFINIDASSPRHHFSTPPEHHYSGETIRVTGKITSYKGIAQIVVKSPSQIEIE